jgi:hypothetical protein
MNKIIQLDRKVTDKFENIENSLFEIVKESIKQSFTMEFEKMNSKIYQLTSELSQIKTAVTQTFSLATPSAEKMTKNQSQLKEAQENKKLMTFNRNSIEDELVKWQCTQNLDSEAESNGQESEKLK